MTNGEALKSLLRGGVVGIKISFPGRVAPGLFDADIALKIWEYLNKEVDQDKQDPVHVDPPKHEKRRKLDDGKMLALRKAGWSYEKIADEMGCSTQTVINHIREKE